MICERRLCRQLLCRDGSAPRVAIFIEPSPFSHVSGMKIRFLTLIRELRRVRPGTMNLLEVTHSSFFNGVVLCFASLRFASLRLAEVSRGYPR